jgi:hypothetical protein
MLPHIWDESNLQMLIEATTQHEPEIAHCAEFKKYLLAAQKPGSVLGPSPSNFQHQESRSGAKQVPLVASVPITAIR